MKKCRQLNNFSTLTSIISALGTAPIHRLGRTWSQVNQKTMATLEAMRKLMGSTKNFLEYREALHKANPPCIPFFGGSLKYTSMRSGNADFWQASTSQILRSSRTVSLQSSKRPTLSTLPNEPRLPRSFGIFSNIKMCHTRFTQCQSCKSTF